jgi:hypothetical protein
MELPTETHNDDQLLRGEVQHTIVPDHTAASPDPVPRAATETHPMTTPRKLSSLTNDNEKKPTVPYHPIHLPLPPPLRRCT